MSLPGFLSRQVHCLRCSDRRRCRELGALPLPIWGEGWGEGGRIYREIRPPSPGALRAPTSPLRGEVELAAPAATTPDDSKFRTISCGRNRQPPGGVIEEFVD